MSILLRLRWEPGDSLSANLYPLDGSSGPLNGDTPFGFTETNRSYLSTLGFSPATGTYAVDIIKNGRVAATYLVDVDAAGGQFDLCDGPTAFQLAADIGEGIIVQNNLQITPAIAEALAEPSTIPCLRGDTLKVALTLGTITGRTKLVFTAKANINDSDSMAIIQIVEGVGLVILNGQSPTGQTASLTVVNETTGETNLEIDANATVLLQPRDLVWDCQAWLPSGIETPANGCLQVLADVTQAVT